MGLEVRVRRRLKGFTLDVGFSAEGGVLGLLGPSGSGKSMTLRSIAGIDRPDAGRIALDGEMLYHSGQRINLRPRQRRVGYLFQSYALFPHMTAAQNIGCGLPGKNRRARVLELMKRFQLQGLENRYPRQLSGGQAQRVAVARCLAAEPRALLLDEPFSALDTRLREQMHTELRNMLQGYAGQVVLVTHDQREAYRLCAHLAVLDGGRCVAQGETRRLFAQPELLSVARLTGCRNLSRAVRLGAHRVRALDWDVELTTAREVPPDVMAVGIRQSGFAAAPDADGENGFIPQWTERLEEADAVQLCARLSENPAAKGLWVLLAKGGSMPGALRVAPEEIQVLRGGE